MCGARTVFLTASAVLLGLSAAIHPFSVSAQDPVYPRKANVVYIEDFYRNFGYPFAHQANGGSLKGMLEAADLIAKLADPQTTLIPGHGTLIKEQNLLPYKSMVADILAR
jgi:hypothetical protein